MRQKSSMLLVAGLGGFLNVVPLATEPTWTRTSAPSTHWAAIASSADGIKLLAAGRLICVYGCYYNPFPIFTSADSGLNWTQTSAPTNSWSSVASSADGTKLVAVVAGRFDSDAGEWIGGPIYISADSGLTWTQTPAPTNSWSSVASSADGTKLVAVGRETLDKDAGPIGGGPIFVSANSGVTWKQSTAPTNSWTSVASSADGTKLVAVATSQDSNAGDGSIYHSSDSGESWLKTGAPTTRWISVASSADGTKLVAVSDYDSVGLLGSMYASTNSGATWAPTIAPGDAWASVASSADGTKVMAASSSGLWTSSDSGANWTEERMAAWSWPRRPTVTSSADGSRLVAAADGIYTSSYSGPWKSSGAPLAGWTSVASSDDGFKLVAVANTDGFSDVIPWIYTSADSGATWARTSAPSNSWSSVASSMDGNKLVAAVRWLGGAVYASSDSGTTWRQTTAPSNGWNSVASSADGTKLVAANDSIYTSTNSGATWMKSPAPGNDRWSVASSADGSNLLAAGLSLIYTSTNSGATWAQTTAPRNNWSSVASSADGTRLIASTDSDYFSSGSPGSIYTSDNSGASWTRASAPSNYWFSVACSADGTTFVAAANGATIGTLGSTIYISKDSGVTWTSTGAPGEQWSAVASSADGNKIVAAGHVGQIYTLEVPIAPPPPAPSRWLRMSVLDRRPVISWLVPSSPFVLQQNFNLSPTNWTEVPTTPTLNFTNLNYQVSVQPSPDSRFFRLKQQ